MPFLGFHLSFIRQNHESHKKTNSLAPLNSFSILLLFSFLLTGLTDRIKVCFAQESHCDIYILKRFPQISYAFHFGRAIFGQLD